MKPEILRLLFRAETAAEAAAKGREWLDAEHGVKVVQWRGTEKKYATGSPVWSGLWVVSIEVEYLPATLLGLGL